MAFIYVLCPFLCASLFFKVVTLMGCYKGHPVPCAYIVMSSKIGDLYEAVFNKIKALAPAMEPVNIMSDYEGGLFKGMKKVFGNARFSGCVFHYKKAAFKRIQDPRSQLLPYYNNRTYPAVGRILRTFLGLCYLKPEDMKPTMKDLRQVTDQFDMLWGKIV